MSYNGWTNYATWLINLEMELTDHGAESYMLTEGITPYDLGLQIRESVESYFDEDLASVSRLSRSIVQSFLQEVNWQEIAAHILEDQQDV